MVVFFLVFYSVFLFNSSFIWFFVFFFMLLKVKKIDMTLIKTQYIQ